MFLLLPRFACQSAWPLQLKVLLVILDLLEMKPGYLTPVRSMAETKTFTVHKFKDLDGMRASTELLKSLDSQGYLTLVVKKRQAKSYWENENGENDVELDDSHDDFEARSDARKIARSFKL